MEISQIMAGSISQKSQENPSRGTYNAYNPILQNTVAAVRYTAKLYHLSKDHLSMQLTGVDCEQSLSTQRGWRASTGHHWVWKLDIFLTIKMTGSDIASYD